MLKRERVNKWTFGKMKIYEDQLKGTSFLTTGNEQVDYDFQNRFLHQMNSDRVEREHKEKMLSQF